MWSLGYAASPTKWARLWSFFTAKSRDSGHSMALPDRATQVLDRMVQLGIGQRPILFICHSLGGLLVKQILRNAHDGPDERKMQLARNTRGVLFLATPHAGARLAETVDTFSAIFRSTVSVEELRAHDAHLGNLYNWYHNHAGALGIETRAYYEKRETAGLALIVDPTSARPGVGADPVALDEDHVSIAKPRKRDAQVCYAARDLLRDHVLVPRTVSQQPSPAQQTHPPHENLVRGAISAVANQEQHRTPHELPPAAARFFGRAEQREELTKRLRDSKNTVVVGPAGIGKTALAAEAVRAVVGTPTAPVFDNPFQDGVVFLDLYRLHAQAEATWNALANKLASDRSKENEPARQRATAACRGRRLLVIVEGGEEADGEDGRPSIADLFDDVLSPENCRLVLTRFSRQAGAGEALELKEALQPADAADLFDEVSKRRVPSSVRDRVLSLLEGHPLALTWAGALLGLEEDDPNRLLRDWQADPLLKLSDPKRADHTLKWLFNRSARGLDNAARKALEAAGLLARAPFPLGAIAAALADSETQGSTVARAALKPLVQRGLLRRSHVADEWQFTHVLGYAFARKETGSDPAIRERLGGWLHGHLTAALAPTHAGDEVISTSRALEHVAALLRTDDDQRLWTPLANYTLYDAGDRLVDIGQLILVKLAQDAVEGWFARFSEPKAKEPDWERERSVLFDRQGGVLRAQGDLSGALSAFQASLAVIQRLAASDPSDAGWQSDLSVIHDHLGDVLSAQGDLAGALSAFQASLAVIQRLAASDPSDAGWQRDLSVIQERLGDVLRAQADLSGALSAFQASLAVRQRLAASNPSNAGRQRDLSVIHDNLGDVLRAQGDLSGALSAFQASLAVRQRLAASDPSNALWQRDLSLGLMRIAQVHEQHGNRAEALSLAQKGLRIAERLVALDPTNATWRRDVVVSRNLVAHLQG